MKNSRNILNFLALNRFVIKNSAFDKEFPDTPALNISNNTFVSFFWGLADINVRYLVLGGVASAFYGHIQPVSKIHLWLASQKQNIQKLNGLLGTDLDKYKPTGFQGVYKEPIAEEVLQVFISFKLKCFDARDFDLCYAKREKATINNVNIPILNLDDLLTEKMASGDPKDEVAIRVLQKAQSIQQSL